jgi:hypothetical protein
MCAYVASTAYHDRLQHKPDYFYGLYNLYNCFVEYYDQINYFSNSLIKIQASTPLSLTFMSP